MVGPSELCDLDSGGDRSPDSHAEAGLDAHCVFPAWMSSHGAAGQRRSPCNAVIA